MQPRREKFRIKQVKNNEESAMKTVAGSVYAQASIFLLAGAALLGIPRAHAAAAPDMVVEAVQMPAWLERSGASPVPLSPGMELRSNDQLKTGDGSRLLLRSRDGSSVKLGANATFKLDSLQQRSGNVFAATMNVLEGAFRFTTDSLSRYRGRREVTIHVANVTAGIRGTDLWGKSAPNRQVVCLIEGRIEVAPPGEAPIAMDQALQFYVRDNGVSQPLAPVPAAQLQEWATETEIAAGRGAMRRGGHWKIRLGSVDTQAAALAFYDRVREAGYAADILPTREGDKHVYTVRLSNLPSKFEADALAANLKGRLGIEAPTVSR
jgi:hypothetical protein